MSSTVGAVAAGSHRVAATTSTGAPQAEQVAALNQMLNRYQAGLSRGESTAMLASLGRQITAAAKILGQHVTLPKAPATAATAAPASSRREAGGVSAAKPKGAVDTTA